MFHRVVVNTWSMTNFQIDKVNKAGVDELLIAPPDKLLCDYDQHIFLFQHSWATHAGGMPAGSQQSHAQS